jgi:CheY-like chemotaxis protein
MAHVLLIDADPSRSTANGSALTKVGHDVTLAPSGAFALTMLERARPDVIVSWLQVEDMYAYELCAIVRADPMTRAIPFILLTGRSATSPEAVAQAVAELPAAPEAPASARPDEGASLDGRVSGVDTHAAPEPGLSPTHADTLQTTQLGEAFHAVSDGRKTGRLVACVGGTEGALLFRAGRLVHAEFQGQQGELAVTSLLVAATGSASGHYRFHPWDGSEVPKRAWAVDHAAEQLLLNTWAETDAEPNPESV